MCFCAPWARPEGLRAPSYELRPTLHPRGTAQHLVVDAVAAPSHEDTRLGSVLRGCGSSVARPRQRLGPCATTGGPANPPWHWRGSPGGGSHVRTKRAPKHNCPRRPPALLFMPVVGDPLLPQLALAAATSPNNFRDAARIWAPQRKHDTTAPRVLGLSSNGIRRLEKAGRHRHSSFSGTLRRCLTTVSVVPPTLSSTLGHTVVD